ncbi:unnamed protein product [Parascedosporium putredinis]|uniref:BRO1 domain-containing protein n=1 Tax=Parascedosporium putredinis TaxID=1442378 RepID=A0A9P1HCS5_9PEZI|nr:unnamed protein product [Parascedosporium putredinis]CAI8004974.1 unnamed protein product [Parascedosporium putredinis]
MATNILSLPFRKGVHLSLSSAIKKYISVKYDQHPDMFRQDLEVIDALRSDAINVREPHLSGVKRLQAYAAQLVWIGGKFPIDIGADFTWYPALGYNVDRPVSRNNLKYELLSVLFNLAALYSQLAHMIKEVLPELRMSDPPDDMDEHTLESLLQLSLAQSQECFWQKAVMDGYRDSSIAKLAACVSDLYNLAGEAAVKSEGISTAWIHQFSAKQRHFAAAAQYRAARDCLEKRKFGEEVARLQDAVICVTDGLKDLKKSQLNKQVAEDLQNLKKKVEEDLKRAEKDNDMIYLNPVPAKAELKILDRAKMAIAKTPPQVEKPLDYLGDQAEFGPALFSRLVPFSVHQATSIYEERRDRLVNQSLIQGLEILTEDVHVQLSSLGLPGSLQALEKPLGLPHSLTQHAEEIRQADAINRIERSFADIEKLRSADQAVYADGIEILNAEEEEDNRLRSKYGTDRWNRPPGRQDAHGSALWGLVQEIEGYLSTSLSSDNVVREKFASVAETLGILGGSDRQLMNYVPSSLQATIPENLKFFERRLDKLYEPELEAADKEKVEQERLLAELVRVNREFESQKKRGDSGTKLREERLQTLEAAYFKYKEIINNLEVGRKFYNDLSRIVGQQFRDQARAWANQRRMEARSLEEELSLPPLSTLSINRTPVHSPPAAAYQAADNTYFPSRHSSTSSSTSSNTKCPIKCSTRFRNSINTKLRIDSVSAAAAAGSADARNMGARNGNQVCGTVGFAGERQYARGKPPVGGTWDPNSGIKFG